MIADLTKYLPQRLLQFLMTEKNAREAYDLWSEEYDVQPGNLMLDLDELLFTSLLSNLNIADKKVADIGCGTGRHWPGILQQKPATLTGFDVSAGMLHRLEQKFPWAETYQVTDNHYLNIAKGSFDAIISTLTVAHIKNIDEALKAWSRILKPKADIIITDFHPDALAMGGKRTFKYEDKRMAVRNFVHKTQYIKHLLAEKKFRVVNQQEVKIDESVKHYYEAQNAIGVYKKFEGMPIIYGIHFSRNDDIA